MVGRNLLLEVRDGEIIPPDPHAFDRVSTTAAGRAFRGAMHAVFERASMERYLAVFGAVPDTRPYRQWLYVGRNYTHIADVWQNRDIRERLLERFRRDRRARKLHHYLERDLAHLDEFAAQLGPTVERLVINRRPNS
jgi:hypothetical protein